MRAWCKAAIVISASIAWVAPAFAIEPWKTIKAGTVFTFMAPASVLAKEPRGIDSLVGEYDSEEFGLWFDYGPYTGPFGEDATNDPRFASPAKLERIVIDGREAQLLTGLSAPSGACEVISDLFIAGPTTEENLSMTSCGSRAGASDVRRIYQSVRFSKRR